MKKELLGEFALNAGKKVADWMSTDDGKAFLCGRYTDGTPRSFTDAWNDEIMSPETRKKRMKKLEKKQRELEEKIFGKPKKKHKKKGKKRDKIKDSYWMNDYF